MYSQKKEDDLIWDYFKDKPTGTLLDIGANDGRTFSNSRLLIENGWRGVFVEASPKAFARLEGLYKNTDNILFPYAITDYDGEIEFYESGGIRIRKSRDNVGLVSTASPDWIPRWGKKVSFEKIIVSCKSFNSFLKESPSKKFDFISIDIEGWDLVVLQQMNLGELGCQIICIEHDHHKEIPEYLAYCSQWGFKEVGRTDVNLILKR